MPLTSTLARLEAWATGRAQPLATVRHRYLAPNPMVLVPLTTAGEAGAPLGAMVGTDPHQPRLLVVPQPRDRDLRFAFLAELAEAVLPHLEAAQDDVTLEPRRETDPDSGERVEVRKELCAWAPQLLVPNGQGVEYVRLLGRSMRFRRVADQEPEGGPRPEVPPAESSGGALPLLGRWLTHYAERARVPGASLLLSMTGLLTRHWATGQSHVEDQHLGALLAWIDPPEGLTGAEAASRVELERDADGVPVVPPAGPATDPAFDNRRLAPAIDRYDAAVGPAARRRAAAEVRELVASQLRPTWEAMWRGLALLRRLPEAAHVPDRLTRDRWSYTTHRDRVRAGEPPQPRRDDAVTAARKLAARETAQAQLEAQEALDDPLVMAGRRLLGEAFAGEVVAVEEAHTEGRNPRPRPLVTVVTEDGPPPEPGTRVYRALSNGRTQTGEVVRTAEAPPGAAPHGPRSSGDARAPDGAPSGADGADGSGAYREGASLVVVRLLNGMGRGKVPEPGSVPAEGEPVCWTLFEHNPRGGPRLPDPEDTPWTHGGPVRPDQHTPEPDPVTSEDYL